MKTVLWRNRTLLPILVTVGATLGAAPLTDALAFGGGGGHVQRGGGGGGGFHGGGGGGGGFHGGGGGGAHGGGGPRGGGGQINNAHADPRSNNVRNTSVNNVNVNRNVNVNANGNYHGDAHHGGGDHHDDYHHGGWDDDYHPIATAAAVTATVAVTSAVIGSMVRTVPANCVPVNYGGMIYQQCGSTWYQPQGAQYVVVRAPY